MDYHKITMKGDLVLEKVSTLPTPFDSDRDKGRLLYNRNDDKFYFGNDTQWIEVEDAASLVTHETQQLDVTGTNTTKNKHLSNSQGKKWEDHVDNNGLHVTSADKTNWNDNITDLNTHVNNNDIHVTASDKTDWNDAVTDLSDHVNDMDIHSRETFKNKLINGCFRISQRSDSVTQSSGSHDYRTVDRWETGITGTPTSGYCTSSKQDSVLADFSYIKTPNYYRLYNNLVLNANTTETIASQLIEDYVSLSGQDLTLSFWARGSQVSKVLVIARAYNTNRANENIHYYELIDLNTVWTKYSINFTAPTVSEIITDGGSGNYVDWNFQIALMSYWGDNMSTALIGTNLPQTTLDALNAAYIPTGQYDLAEVQLEEGETASSFERRFVGTELLLCQRYFEDGEKYQSAWGAVGYDNEMWVTFKQTKRIGPTVSANINQGGTSNVSGILVINTNINGFWFVWSASSPGDAAPYVTYFSADAEI